MYQIKINTNVLAGQRIFNNARMKSFKNQTIMNVEENGHTTEKKFSNTKLC